MTPKPITLPKALERDLAGIAGTHVVVAAVLTVSLSDLERYSTLGRQSSDGRIVSGIPSLPPPALGVYARRNLEGWTVKRKDLPKEVREVSSWAPSWNSGDFHAISRDVLAYPLEHHAAKMLTISGTVLENLVDSALVRFRVDQSLDRRRPTFAADLQFNMKLLREAVGDARVYGADLSDDEFARIQRVDWELLPPGSAERVLRQLAERSSADPERLKVARERIRVLDSLGHDGYIVGTGRFARYFGAKFGPRLVALENLKYGNALYVFTEDWEKLTQHSRTELIKQRDPTVQRIRHIPGWRNAFRKLIVQARVEST